MKIYPVFIILLLSSFLQKAEAQSVAYSLANPTIEVVGVDSFYEIDVMIFTQNPGETFFMSSGQLYFNYNMAAFGPNVAGNNKIEILLDFPGYLLNLKETEFGLLNVYQLLPINDNTLSRVSVPWGQDRAGNCISLEVTDVPVPLFRLRIQFAQNGSNEPPDICFESFDLFTNQTYTRCGPFGGPCSAVAPADCTNDPGTQMFGDIFYCNLLCGMNGIPSVSSPSTIVCSEPGGQWVHLENNLGEVIVSVNTNGDDLGLIDAEVFIDPVVDEFNGDAYLQRHYRINSTNPVSGVTNLRLYFTSAELNNLINAAILTPDPFDDVVTANDLAVTKYSGPTEDGVFDPSDATSFEFITPISRGLVFGENYIEIQVNSFSEFWIHGLNTGFLPIEVLSFTGRKVDDGALLEWATATEVNSSHFEIEHSNDSQSFERIGVIEAAGNSTEQRFYSFLDEAPLTGKNYYRLKIVDLDGSFSYSEIILLQYQELVTIGIQPNPVTGRELEFSVISPFSGNVLAEIIDVQGRILVREQMTLAEDVNHRHLQIGHLSPGVYHLRLSDNEHYAVRKFVKLE